MAKDNKTPNGFHIHSGKDENGVPYSGIYGKDTITPIGRLAFVHLATPQGQGARAAYSVNLLVDKKNEQYIKELKEIQQMCKLMAMDFWGARAEDMLKKIKRPFFINGDEPSSTGKVYDGYPGHWIIQARNKEPKGVTKGFKVLGSKMAEELEAGMFARLGVTPYLNADGYSYKLRAVRFEGDDGVRFGGAPDPALLFDHLEEAVAAVANDASGVNLDGLL